MPIADFYGDPTAAARSMLGADEAKGAAAIRDYLTTGGANLDPATQAWCAAFVNASLQHAGMQGTGRMDARSFMDWGQPVDQPQPGDVAVFSRGDPNGWQGHVGFFQGYGPNGEIEVLGGNQGNSVSVAGFDPSRLLGFRRAAGQGINPNAPRPGGDGDALAALFAARAQDRGTPQQRAAGQDQQKQRRAALYDVASLYG